MNRRQYFPQQPAKRPRHNPPTTTTVNPHLDHFIDNVLPMLTNDEIDELCEKLNVEAAPDLLEAIEAFFAAKDQTEKHHAMVWMEEVIKKAKGE